MTSERKDSRTRAAQVAVLIAAAVAFVLVRVPFVSVPFERDEGEYAYIAQRALLGEVPYRDSFDQKPPGVFLAYVAAFAILGQTVEAVHLFLYAWTGATALALYGCVRRLAGPLSAAFAVLLFALASADPRLTANAANTELFMLLPMVASIYCMLRALEDQRAHWWALCGAFAALACWFKQVAGLSALYVAVVAAADWLARRPGISFAALLRAYAWLGVGALATTAPVLLFFAGTGAWDPFVDAVFLYNLTYSRALSVSKGWEALRHQLAGQAPSLGVLWGLAVAAVLLPRLGGRRSWALLSGWAAASVAGVGVGLYFRPHYFIQALPALASLGGVTLGAAGARFLASQRVAAAALAPVALVAVAAAPPIVANQEIRGVGGPAEISREIYGLNPFPESAEIAKYIRRTSTPEDRIYIVGSEPQILFYARRASATRYIFFYPLAGDSPGDLARQRSVVKEIEAARPLYVIWSNIETSLQFPAASDNPVLSHAREMLDRDYRLEFVAYPRQRQQAFDFVYALEARRLLARAGERADSAPWIALYRRRPGR